MQATYARLREALDENVYIGSVNYISYERDKIPAVNTFWPLIHKRRSFEYERELRPVWSDIANIALAGPAVASGHEYRSAPQQVVWKRFDLFALIENVFVSPDSAPWFLELVKKVLQTYSLNLPVRRSDLAAEPLFY